MKIYTATQMRQQEAAAVACGTSLLQLMENAGCAAAADVLSRQPFAQRILILCGKGNNGGDALVMARVLAQQDKDVVVVFVLGKKLSHLAQQNRNRLPENVRVASVEAVCNQTFDIVIDAVFGIGFSGSLPEAVAAIFCTFKSCTAVKIALDVPSGMNCDTAEIVPDTFIADITYAFGAYKPAHVLAQAQKYCGQVICLPIGIE